MVIICLVKYISCKEEKHGCCIFGVSWESENESGKKWLHGHLFIELRLKNLASIPNWRIKHCAITSTNPLVSLNRLVLWSVYQVSDLTLPALHLLCSRTDSWKPQNNGNCNALQWVTPLGSNGVTTVYQFVPLPTRDTQLVWATWVCVWQTVHARLWHKDQCSWKRATAMTKKKKTGMNWILINYGMMCRK